LTLLNGLLLANGPFGVVGRLLPNGDDELDGPNSFKGAGDPVAALLAGLSNGLADLLAGLSNGLGNGPDLLVGLSKTLFLVVNVGSVFAFSTGFDAGAGGGSGLGSAGKIDFSSLSSITP
jgi:hypothetical protein